MTAIAQTEKREVLAYPPTAILTVQQLADWLQVSPRTINDWQLPALRYPTKEKRFSAGQVLRFLEGE